jgi:hypothetical protein
MGAYAFQYYSKLGVVYNKYYLKHTTTISHKPTFCHGHKGPYTNTIEKRVKEDSMEAWLWAQRLEDLLESCAVKDVVQEVMTPISWHCTTKGPNLHVAKAHFERTPTTLQATFFRTNHLVK